MSWKNQKKPKKEPFSKLVEQNTFEAQEIFAQNYDVKRYYKLTRGLWVLITAIIILLVFSVLLVLNSSYKGLYVIHAYQGNVARYELRLGNKNRIWIKDVQYLGPYSTSTEYKGMKGQTALLAKFIDRFDAQVVICGKEQVYELALEGYIISVENLLGDDAGDYSDVSGVGNEEFYGYDIGRGLEVVGTSQALKFADGEYIAVIEEANTGRVKRSVIYFLEYYYDK